MAGCSSPSVSRASVGLANMADCCSPSLSCLAGGLGTAPAAVMTTAELRSAHSRLAKSYAKLADVAASLDRSLEAKLGRIEALSLQQEEREQRWAELLEEVEAQARAGARKVKLNVGGQVFATARENLLRWDNTFFHALLQEQKWELEEEEGAYFVDRDPEMFKHIIQVLRSGDEGHVLEVPWSERRRLFKELDFFQLPPVPLSWDAVKLAPGVHLLERDSVVASVTGTWQFVVTTRAVDRFKVRLLSEGASDRRNGMVGFVPQQLFCPGEASGPKGWALRTLGGALCSPKGDRLDSSFLSRSVARDETIECVLSREARTISFSINGSAPQVAFRNVDFGRDVLLPCVDILNCVFRLL